MEFLGPSSKRSERGLRKDTRIRQETKGTELQCLFNLRPCFVLLQLSLGILLLTGCDLDINLRQALILDDPANFIGEQQIEIEIQGSSLRTAEHAGVDCEGLAARVLREKLPKYWKASWQKNYESFIIEISIPFEGLKDYGLKLHRVTQAKSYLDLPETLSAASLANFRARPLDLPLDLQRGKPLGEEIYERARAEIQAAPKDLATSYFLPCRHILRNEDGELLLYLSLGKQGHLTNANISYAERIPDMTPQFDSLCRELQDLVPEFSSDSPVDGNTKKRDEAPRLRHSDSLLIIGEQIYRCPRDRSDPRMTVLHQNREFPLILELETRTDNFMSFDRYIRFRLPPIPGYEASRSGGLGLIASPDPKKSDAAREALFRLMERLNLELDPEEEYEWVEFAKSEDGANLMGGYLQAGITKADPSTLRQWSRNHLDPSYELNLSFEPSENLGKISDAGSASFLCHWDETFGLPRFFHAREADDPTTASDAESGLESLDESEALSGSRMAEALRTANEGIQPDLHPALVSRGLIEGRQEDTPLIEIQTELDARRSWPLLGIENYWDDGIGRRFHFLMDPADEVGFLEYLEGTELESRAEVIESHYEEPYQRIVLEVQDLAGNKDVIEAWTEELFGGSDLRATARKGFVGEKLELEEIFNYWKLKEDQIVVLLDEGEALEAEAINPSRMMPLSGRARYELPSRSFVPYYALTLLGLCLLLSFRPEGRGRAYWEAWKERIAHFRKKRKEDEALRPLHWGDTFIDSNDREIYLTRPENARPAARKILRFR